jgi:hypothetical protein
MKIAKYSDWRGGGGDIYFVCCYPGEHNTTTEFLKTAA